MADARRIPGRPFQKGAGGRPKGAVNKATANAREIAAGVLTPEVFKKWKQQALAGTLDAGIVKTLLLYMWGRPRYDVAIQPPDDKGRVPMSVLLGGMTREERAVLNDAMDRVAAENGAVDAAGNPLRP
jgi:hypothetical protein